MNNLYRKITSIEALIDYMNFKKYNVDDDINIVNIRSNITKAGDFDDLQILFYKDKDKWYFIKFEVTTDPGIYYLINPMRKSGAAIVLEGQYWRVWKIGLHRGKYEALVQSKPIIVVRDNNKDAVLDMPGDDVWSVKNNMDNNDLKQLVYNDITTGKDVVLERGMFGINCHRASSYRILDKIGRYSAGCCVHKDPVLFKRFIDHVKVIAGNSSFDATWIDERSLDKFLIDTYKK